MMDYRFIDLITYAYDDETKIKILQSYEDKLTLLDVDLFQEHLMVQPVLAVIILSLILVSFLILLFSIIFIGCRALGNCGAKRYQAHPTNGRHYSAHLVVFLCSWFLMATASSYYAYCGLHLWNVRPPVIPKTASLENQHDIQKRSADQQTVFDLFDNPDYQGDFEQIETSTPSLAFVTEKVEKSMRPRFPLHRLPRVQDSSEDSPPAVEQLPIFPINFTSRVPLASTVISPIEIPARPKAELDFKRLLDGEKLVPSNIEEAPREHMNGAFVGDGLPRARNFISSMKRPMSSLGTSIIRAEEVSAEIDPTRVDAQTLLEDEPAPPLMDVGESAFEPSTGNVGLTSTETTSLNVIETSTESTIFPNDEKTLETTTNLKSAQPTTSEVFILSMNDDEPETTEISVDFTASNTQTPEQSVDNAIERVEDITPESSSAPTPESSSAPISLVEGNSLESSTSEVIEVATVSTEIEHDALNSDETTPVSLPESTKSEEVTTLASFRSDEVLSSSRPLQNSSFATTQQYETSTSSMDLSTSAMNDSLQNVLSEEVLNSKHLINETEVSLIPDQSNTDPPPSTTTNTATDNDFTNTSRTSDMTESTNTPMTTDEETTVKPQDLSLENSKDDLGDTVPINLEPQIHQNIEESKTEKEEEEEEIKITSTLAPTITVLNTKSQSRRPTTVHTFPNTPLDEGERRSISELLASPNLHPFRPLNTTAVLWIHRISLIILSSLVLFVLPSSLILVLIGTICYIRSYHPMDRSRLSEKIGQFTVLLAVLFLFSLPIFVLYIAMVLSYNHVYNSICPDIQLQYQHHLGLLVGTPFNTLSSNSHRLNANTENCFRSQEPILGLWMSTAVFVLSALPFVFSLFKLSKYYLRMKTEYYWTIADYGTIYAKRALHTDAIYGNIYGTLRSKRPTSRPPPAPNNENAIYGESPVYGTYSAFGHI